MTNEGRHDQVSIMRHSTLYPFASLLLALVACNGTTVNDGGGSDGSPTAIATLIQEPPLYLASDGTRLFWTDPNPQDGIQAMPVGGGSITTVVPGPVLGGGFLYVDDVNVYYQGRPDGGNQAFYRAPKDGSGTPSALSEANESGYTVLGANAYWEEFVIPQPTSVKVMTARLPAGAPSVIAQYSTMNMGVNIGGPVAVTTTTCFLGSSSFPLSTGIPDGGAPTALPGARPECSFMVSDTNAVYCYEGFQGSLLRIANDGTETTLGMVLTNGMDVGVMGSVAVDDTFVYWADHVTVGTIMKVPKAGGTPTLVARDTTPRAIAVDSTSIYWSDDGGNIMRLAK